MSNFTLGPSWLPKLGAVLAAIAGATELIPPNAPGADYIKPYQSFLLAVSASIIGFTARQNNVSSEKAGASTEPTPTPTPKP